MNVLVVEDEDPKRRNVMLALRGILPDAQALEARSVSTAIQQLRSARPSLMLLDMSLPTFDVTTGEPGGRPQGFGGIEVLRYLDRFGLTLPVIVITAYEAFSREGQQIDLRALEEQLSKAHPSSFRGIVLYNPTIDQWRRDLQALILRAIAP